MVARYQLAGGKFVESQELGMGKGKHFPRVWANGAQKSAGRATDHAGHTIYL